MAQCKSSLTNSKEEQVLGIQEWPFTGASGTEYTMYIQGLSVEAPQLPTVYLFAYAHPRGHLAGHMVEPVFIGETDDLRACLDNHPAMDCVRRECGNCVCWLECDDPDRRQRILEDLRRIFPVKCG